MNNNSMLLPARLNLKPESFQKLELAVLPFPFAKVVESFCLEVDKIKPPQKKRQTWVPYRQLNNALLACASTLTCGFEKAGYGGLYRALAVGTPERPLLPPEPSKLLPLIQIWGREWAKNLLDPPSTELENLWKRFSQELSQPFPNWNWVPVPPLQLLNDIYTRENLIFQAVPSLLAMLLHERSITIETQGGQQEIRWRKVQGDGSDKTGVYVVSQPFKGWYVDQAGNNREGYFAYRLDFSVQTQAGRFNAYGKLRPWVFMKLSCQRYAHEPLLEPNYNRNISILMGANKARIDGYPIDSTLVRLQVENTSSAGSTMWKDRLPILLKEFRARPLKPVEQILNQPSKYGNLDDANNWTQDEYYVVHAEGYEYIQEHGRGHAIKTGFSLDERGEIFAQVLKLLEDFLDADVPLTPDTATPKGKTMPMAMRNFAYLETRPDIHKSALEKALKPAFSNQKILIYVFWREQSTLKAIEEYIKSVFPVDMEGNHLHNVEVVPKRIDNADLLKPLPIDKEDEAYKKDRKKWFRKQQSLKRDSWRSFLQSVIPQKNKGCFAIIEIGQIRQKGIMPQQGIRGAIREACAMLNVNSQMVQTAKLVESKDDSAPKLEYSSSTKGRVKNAVLDLVVRQTGILFGNPAEVYSKAGLPESIAPNLDVITLYRYHSTQYNVLYVLATRLRATGEIDVMLPDSEGWIPYHRAGFIIGQVFSAAQSDRANRSSGTAANTIKLSGTQLAQFVAKIILTPKDRPTIVVLEAEGWRNESRDDGKIWPQLKNDYLLAKRDVLDFMHVPGYACFCQRSNEKLNNLLGVIRLRSGQETPQYITNHVMWDDEQESRDFIQLSGFMDWTVPKLMHYFSVGRIPDTQKKKQGAKSNRGLYKTDFNLKGGHPRFDEYGANIPFKHQQLVELVPFFVRQDLQTEEGLKALCRSVHYLRSSPAWAGGNLVLPYPMHLGKCLIEDQDCIIGAFD